MRQLHVFTNTGLTERNGEMTHYANVVKCNIFKYCHISGCDITRITLNIVLHVRPARYFNKKLLLNASWIDIIFVVLGCTQNSVNVVTQTMGCPGFTCVTAVGALPLVYFPP